MYTQLVEKFCTIPKLPLTSFDLKAVADAEKFKVEFEDNYIQCYSWGSGKTILLAHGWGSRASHLAPLGRILSSAGFKVIAFDMPGHSSLDESSGKRYSNMFEFCRTISAVAKNIGKVYAIVGHSLGAASAAVTIAGLNQLAGYKIEVDKLILISSPADIKSMIKVFCKNNNLGNDDVESLAEELEKEFNFKIKDYLIADAVKNISVKVLLIHDFIDDEVSIADANEICNSATKIKSYFTNGSGHFKILMNRGMLSSVKDFLADE